MASTHSLVEQADSVDTGKRRFDTYFAAVIELRDRVKDLDSDMFPLREPLVETLELNVDVPMATLIEKVRRQAKKQRDYGIFLSLRLLPTPKLIVDRTAFEGTDHDETLVRSVEESANRALSTYRKYREYLSVVNRLRKRRSKLADGLEGLEPTYMKRDLIEHELKASGRVLRSIEKKLFRDTRTISFFMVALADAADTGADAKRDKTCEDALAGRRPRKSRRRRGRRRGRGKVRKRPPPSGGDDFSM